jgi:hypothetical protein
MSIPDRRRWLTQHHEGRLRYRTGRGPRALAMTYVVAGDYILVRIPEFNPAAGYASGQQIEFQVPHGNSDICVRGRAETAGPAHVRLLQQTRFLEHWPAGVRSRVLCLPLSDVTHIEPPVTEAANFGAVGVACAST